MAEARPSSSIILLSPTNQVLLLHRVQTSTSFPSAHVFPGGNLSPFHESPLPPDDPSHEDPHSPHRHRDSPAYRLAAIRETFEESGILLARPSSSSSSSSASASASPNSDNSHDQSPLLTLPEADREKARGDIHGDRLHFKGWVEGDLGGRLCTDDLVPFTRWVTPPNQPKRFTTQMYLFLMPPSSSSSSSSSTAAEEDDPSPQPGTTTGSSGAGVVDVDVVQTPTPDGGVEHTAATFADAGEWLRRQEAGEIVLFPPQCYLLTLVAGVFGSVPGVDYAAQRRALMDFVGRTPTSGAGGEGGRKGRKAHPTDLIPWSEKVMSPHTLFIREGDGRIVLGVDKPGPELKGSGRGGDFERVVLVKFTKQGPRNVEIRDREDVLREEKEAKAKKGAGKL